MVCSPNSMKLKNNNHEKETTTVPKLKCIVLRSRYVPGRQVFGTEMNGEQRNGERFKNIGLKIFNILITVCR